MQLEIVVGPQRVADFGKMKTMIHDENAELMKGVTQPTASLESFWGAFATKDLSHAVLCSGCVNGRTTRSAATCTKITKL
jgi:hypothetical protein